MVGRGYELREITHLSYSAHNDGLSCLKKLQLTRMTDAPRQPAVWLAGGLAVHAVTEAWDRAVYARSRQRFDLNREWRKAYGEAIADLREQEPDISRWRSSKTEDINVWGNHLGPELVGNYIRWRQLNPEWEIASLGPDDSEPAIELDVSTFLPGCDLEIKAYVDRVFWNPNLQVHKIVDIKTGTRLPDSPLQFGVYAACITQKYNTVIDTGAAFMNRRSDLSRPYHLGRYTPLYVGNQLGKTAQIIKRGLFTAHVTPSCERMCDVRDACAAYGGHLAERYDPDSDPAPF